MKAILLSAGHAKRLRPLSNTIPKCLIEINNIPIIDIWIKEIIKLGIDKIYVNTHHLSEKIMNHLRLNNYFNKIEIFYEKELLGTAKTVRQISENFSDDCLVAHSDNYFEEDLLNLINSYKKRPQKSLATIMSFKVDNPKNYGVFEYDENKIVKNFYEKKDVKFYNANCAVYIFSKKFFEKEIISKNDVDLSLDILPKLIHKSNLFFTNKKFVDIGTFEGLKSVGI